MDISFLRETRKKADLTQDEMAPLMQLSRPAISKIENGERTLKAADLLRWLQVVGGRMQSTGTTSIEAVVNGVDIIALTQMLTSLVGGFIKWF